MSNKSDYFHSFPNAVDAFAKYGKKKRKLSVRMGSRE